MTAGRRYRLITAGLLAVVVLNAVVAYRALGSLFAAQRWLAHTLEVLTHAEETQLSVSSAANATRSYLLVGKPEFLNRYQASRRDIAANLDLLAHLTADNVSQRQRVAFLRQRVAVRLAAFERAMQAREAGGSAALTPAVLNPALQDSPDGGPGVKYVLQEMEKEERRLLGDRYSEASEQRHNVVLTIGAASLLDLILLLIAFQLLIRSLRAREELAERSAQITLLNDALSRLNEDLEGRVEERTRELEVSNRELQAFSYSVSHDLRAPLRTIDGFSLALEEDFADVLNADGRDYIKRVRGGVQRMGMLIDALLQLSRVTRSEVQREPVNLSDQVTLIFRELLADEAAERVSLRVQPDLVAEADPRLMRVAFENLLGNALKFTSKTPQPAIEFGSERKGEQTVYFIRDNGAGFDMQYVDRLFTAFQRLHGDRDFKGSGIGLATVSRIIQRHHGEIWAEGATGVGATFYFTLHS